MASLLLKGVHKRLGLPSISSISCSSPDATSIVASTSIVSRSGRAIDRHSPRLRDPHRSSASKPPRPSAGSSDDPKQQQQQQLGQGLGTKKKKKSSSAAAGSTDGSGRSSEKTKRLVSPATSSRFLLNSSRMQSDDLDDVLALPPPPPSSFVDVFPAGEGSLIDAFPGAGNASLPLTLAKDKEAPSPVQQQQAQSSSSSSSSASSSSSSEITAVQEDKEKVMARSSSTTTERRTTQAQTVVLRVSLHCKGCAGKVKKHIAKMEGVSSFDIDIVSKKVTVVGDVTPLAVLSSVSKVKPAQFWPSTPQPQPPRVSASF